MSLILVVEDDTEINTLMTLALRVNGYDVVSACDGRQALKIAESRTPDLILLDVVMPKMSGYEVARLMQERDATRHVPIIFVTANRGLDDLVRGLEMAADYVCKPFAAPELVARVRAALRVSKLQEELRASNEKLAQLATTDSLTGLCNRRQFYAALESELQRARRYEQTISLVAFDLDHFKTINDLWGHAQGDAALQQFAQVLESTKRNIDTVARLGGEEFAAILPATGIEGACAFAEKVRQLNESREVPFRTLEECNEPIFITVSAGVVTLLPENAPTLAQFHTQIARLRKVALREPIEREPIEQANDSEIVQNERANIEYSNVRATTNQDSPAPTRLAASHEQTSKTLAPFEDAQDSMTKVSVLSNSGGDSGRDHDNARQDEISLLTQALMQAADRLLYRAKVGGRNRVEAETIGSLLFESGTQISETLSHFAPPDEPLSELVR